MNDSAGGPGPGSKHLRDESLGHTWLHAPGAPRSLVLGHDASFPLILSEASAAHPMGMRTLNRARLGSNPTLALTCRGCALGQDMVLSRPYNPGLLGPGFQEE